MRRENLGLILAGISFLFTGCATVTGGKYEDVNFTSSPDEAKVEVIAISPKKERYHTITPGTLSLRRKYDYQVNFKKDGYRLESKMLQHKMGKATAGSVMGNAVLGGVVGLGVDSYTGAAYNLNPNPMHVELLPLEETKSDRGAAAPSADAVKKSSEDDTGEAKKEAKKEKSAGAGDYYNFGE